MSVLTNGNLKNYKLLHNGQPLKHAYHNATVKLWSAGNTVTYHVDNNAVYTEEIDEGASCLSPKSFTPKKPGWTFVGWRADKAAGSGIYTSLYMGDSPISLYAVFQATVTVTYYNHSTNAGNATGYKYYNNGNITPASFKLSQAGKSGWTARGWSTGTAGNGGIVYNNNSTFTRDSNITLYGMYQQTVTLSYNGNGATGGSVAAQTGTRYYNSNGAYTNPSFTLKANAFTRTGYTFVKWALGSAGGTQYAPGGSISVSGNTTMYAAWKPNAFYAIAPDGVVDKTYCPNAYETWGGYSSGPGSDKTSSDGYSAKKYYGGSGHTDSSDGQGYGVFDRHIDFGCDTGWINTRGCKYVKIMPYVYNWAGRMVPVPYLHIYGNGSETAFVNYGGYPYNNGDGKIYTENNPHTDQFTVTPPSSPLVVDISVYSTIRITYHSDQTINTNAWINCGLQYVYFYS